MFGSEFGFRPLREGKHILHKKTLVETAELHSLRSKLSTATIDTKQKGSFEVASDPKRAKTDEEDLDDGEDSEMPAVPEDKFTTSQPGKMQEEEEKNLDSIAEQAKELQALQNERELKRMKERRETLIKLFDEDKEGALLPSDDDVVEAIMRQIGYTSETSVKVREEDEKNAEEDQSIATKLVGGQGTKVCPLAKYDWDLMIPYNQWVGSGLMALGGRPNPTTFPKESADFFKRQMTVRMFFVVDDDFQVDGDEAAETLQVAEDLDADDFEKEGKMTQEQIERKDMRAERRNANKKKRKIAREARESEQGLEVGGGGQFELGPAPTREDESFKGSLANYRTALRSQLYQYGNIGDQSNEGMVTISYNALQNQARAQGAISPIGKGTFLENCVYGRGEEYKTKVVDGYVVMDLDDEKTRKDYDRTNRFRMELGRKWWQMFNNMEGAVTREIIARGQEDFIEYRDETLTMPDGSEKKITAEQKKSLQVGPMVYAVTELGPYGALYPGKIEPAYQIEQQAIKDENQTSKFEEPLYTTVYKRAAQKDEGEDTLSVTDTWKSTPVGKENDIKHVNDQTWPLVRISKSRRWLDWIKTGIEAKNDLAYKILRLFFGIQSNWDQARIDVDQIDDMSQDDFLEKYTKSNLTRTFAWRTKEGDAILTPLIEESLVDQFGNYRDKDVTGVTDELLNEWWESVERVFDDLVDSCPFWVQSFLSHELVDDPELLDEDTKAYESFQKRAEDSKTTVNVEEAVLNKLKTQNPNGDHTEQQQRYENAVMDWNWYKANAQLKNPKGNTYDMGNFVWNPYPIQITNEMFVEQTIVNKLDEDHDGVANLTWCHEQILRCIVEFKPHDLPDEKHYIVDDYIDTNGNLVRGILRPDGVTLTVGESTYASHMFCNWYKEVVLGLPLGGEGQLVTCTDMFSLFYESVIAKNSTKPKSPQARPWYCNGHGETGIVTKAYPTNYYDVRLFTKVDNEYKERMQGYVDKDGYLVLKEVPAAHIWPLTFKKFYRYGDRGTIDYTSEAITKLKETIASASGSASLAKQMLVMHERKVEIVLTGVGWTGPLGGDAISKIKVAVMLPDERNESVPPAYLLFPEFATLQGRKGNLPIVDKEDANDLYTKWKKTAKIFPAFFHDAYFKRNVVQLWESGDARYQKAMAREKDRLEKARLEELQRRRAGK